MIQPFAAHDPNISQRIIRPWCGLSATARPLVLWLDSKHITEHQIFLEGHNYNKQKQRLRAYPPIKQDEVCCYEYTHYSPVTHVTV